MKVLKSPLIAVSSIALVLGACASKPPVQEEVVTQAPPPPPPAPAPQPTQPAPPPPTPAREGPLPGSLEEFRVRVGERIYFDTDRYDVDALDMQTLDRQAEWLKTYPEVSVMVAGNCDERGTREYNLGLGARRANAAKEYLVSKGIAPSRIETISYGKERPIDGRSTPEAWQMNRNAHTQIISGTVG